MDSGHQPIKNVSRRKNHVARDPPEQPGASSSTESRGYLIDSEVPQFSFELPHRYSQGNTVAPLIDYALFETPVEISLGTLPPRPTKSRAIAKGRIPRPRNAFMLFRSEFHRQQHVDKAIEKDHRHISRIIGICWSALSEEEKNVWRQRAELEKQQHAREYPGYRFKPTPRLKQPVKRNVKRNTPKEIERCQKIAQLIANGKSGEELTDAVKSMEGGKPLVRTEYGTEPATEETQKLNDGRKPPVTDRSVDLHSLNRQHLQPPYTVPDDDRPFRSPLLPPADLTDVSSRNENFDLPAEPGLTSYATSVSGQPDYLSENNDYFPRIATVQGYVVHEHYQQRDLHWNVRSHVPPPQDWPIRGNSYGYALSTGEQCVTLLPSQFPSSPPVAIEPVKDYYQVSYAHPMDLSPMQVPWNVYPPGRSLSRAIAPNL